MTHSQLSHSRVTAIRKHEVTHTLEQNVCRVSIHPSIITISRRVMSKPRHLAHGMNAAVPGLWRQLLEEICRVAIITKPMMHMY